MSTKAYMVETLINDLIRQYPTWPSTFSKCGCGRGAARGGGQCSTCIEEDLAQIIDEEFADDIHATVRYFAHLKSTAIELAENMDRSKA